MQRLRNIFSPQLIVLTLLFCAVANAQPERAEALFADGKELLRSEAIETKEKAFARFAASATLFRAAGNAEKAAEVDLVHGRELRLLAASERDAKRWESALKYFDRAIAIFRYLKNDLQIAYAHHDLGYMYDQRKLPDDASLFYTHAVDGYRLAGDKDGEATVLRNLGVLRMNQKKYAEALAYYESALKLRIAARSARSEAELRIDIGIALSSSGKNDEALISYGEALRLYRQLGDKSNEAISLFNLGTLQSDLFRYAYATANLATALKIYETEKNTASEAETALTLGRVWMSAGKHLNAEPYLLRAAEIYKASGDPVSEGAAHLDLAVVYQSTNRLNETRVAIERGLTLFRDAKKTLDEAYALITYAGLQSYLNQHDDAFAKLKTAQELLRQHDNDNAHFLLTRAYANYHYAVGNHGEAIRYGLRALDLAEKSGNLFRKASMYIDIGISHSALGQRQLSLEYAKKALDLARQIGSAYMESISLSNLGYDNLLLKNYPAAQDYFEKSIKLMQANGFEREEGYSTHNLGLVHYARREYPAALANYDKAFVLYRKTGDRRPEAFLYDSYGELYRDLGQYEKASENLQKAVILAREIRYSEIEAQSLGNMMALWIRRKQPRLAVLYGKQSVNVYQSLRAVNRTADKAALKSFLQSNEKTYRQLANLLIEEGRLPEAQAVLGMLKEEEVFEYLSRDATDADKLIKRADLREEEKTALARYEELAGRMSSIGAEFGKLQEAQAVGKLSVDDQKRFDQLAKDLEQANTVFQVFLRELADEFAKKPKVVADIQENTGLQADLKSWGDGVVALYTIAGDERYRVILTTPDVQTDGKSEIKAVDLNKKIAEFRAAIQDSGSDPRPLGKELYDIIVKPIEKQLEGAKAKTLLWSLDGTLRYVPIAALWDGKQYFGQKYRNVVITLSSRTRLSDEPSSDWRLLGLGVTGANQVTEPSGTRLLKFSALPSVKTELSSIVRENANEQGVVAGKRLLDTQFTEQALKEQLSQRFKVVHIASHFSFRPGDMSRSFLLLGDGTPLTMDKIKTSPQLKFTGVELLTLSACDTAVGEQDANGKEVESFAVVAQQNGAKAVMATLWPVADESTSLFMGEFYRLKKNDPAMNKSEAIRLAQQAMIEGRIKASGTSTACRAEKFSSGSKKDEFKCDPHAPYSHPYFWSPFVLIGNWR